MKILAIGAHYDDVELNALGTLLRFKEENNAELYLIVCTDGSKVGGKVIRQYEQDQVDKLIGYKARFDLDFDEANLSINFELVSSIEKICTQINPDYIITHSEDDFHQDHLAVAKAVRAVNRFSKYSVLRFASQDLKQPFFANCYVDISKYFERKLDILQIYKSQLDKPWLSHEIIQAKNTGVGGPRYTEKFYISYLKI